jgi:hypothetical protein
MAKTTGHYLIENLRIPYQPYSSPVSGQVAFVDGANVLTNVKGTLERRPGFSEIAVPAPVAGFTGTIKRIFLWHKVNGGTTDYYAMICSTSGSNSYVYKFKFDSDVRAVLLYTCTTSGTPFDFVAGNSCVFFGKDDVADEMWKYNGTTKTKWGITKPSTPTAGTAAGALDATSGYFYRTTYGNSSTGHQSSPSDLSACTGNFTSKKVQVSVTASSDAQVDQIHIYRCTDGGSTNPINMQEITGSPFTNVTTSHDDETLDTSLADSFAPALLSCDPPPPLRGFISVANRIAGFSGDTFYYSAFEEIGTSAVPEESWPSGTDGNQRPYATPIYGLAATDTGAAIFTKKKIYGVDGDSLDTFRWGTILENRGTQYPTNVASAGKSILWLDTSKQFWLSDIGEMGVDVRSKLQAMTASQTFVVPYSSGDYNFVLICDAANGLILPANLDNKHWMTPWPVSGITCLHAGETADGTVDLLAAIGGVIYRLKAGTYNDAGATYTAWVKTSLFKIAPDEQPDYYGVMDYLALETDSHPASSVQVLRDDDPTQTAAGEGWQDVTGEVRASAQRARQGSYIIRSEYPVAKDNCQRAALYLLWPSQESTFVLYSIDLKRRVND